MARKLFPLPSPEGVTKPKEQKAASAPKPKKGRALKAPSTLRSNQYPPAGPLRPTKRKQGYAVGVEAGVGRAKTILPPPGVTEEGEYEYTPQSIQVLVKKGFRKAPAKSKPKEVVSLPSGGLGFAKATKAKPAGETALMENSPRRGYTEEEVKNWTRKQYLANLRKFGIDTSDMTED